MSNANLNQQETAQRAEHVQVHAYVVDVDVRDAADSSQPFFPVRATLTLSSEAPSTWLDFIGEVERVTVDGIEQEVRHDGARITLRDLPVGQQVEVVVEGRGRYSRSGEGLHRFTDPVDGETYLYTQYEPADARRVFPCFEQPDMRAPFTFALIGPETWWLGSNQPEVAREQVTEQVMRVEFAPTLTMSTYITCLCAGPYHRETDEWVSADGKPIALTLLSRKSMAQYMDTEELFRVTKAGLDWFTTNFGGYPWGTKYDQIFVPEYNLGAMENPGLVTFTESYLFRSRPTAAQLQGRANTILHEMSHMWFGDLVVPRWWGDLWLKESFAEFMGTYCSDVAAGFEESWVNFATARKVGAYLADSQPTTHPIVADIPDLEAAKTNFDRITYSKGASALTQLVHYVGIDAFLAGSRRYFAAHAFSSATLTDFIAALDAETSHDLSAWIDAWLRTAGHDTLGAELSVADELVQQLVIRRGFAGVGDERADRPHATTVGLYRFVGDRLALDERHEIVVDADAVEVEAAVGRPRPDLVLVNDLDRTFARILLDDDSRRTLLAHIGTLDPLARAVAWTALWHDVRAGLLTPTDFIDAVLTSGESQSGMLASLLQRGLVAASRYSADPAVAARWCDGARAALTGAGGGSAEQQLWARAYLAAAGLAGEDVRWVLDGGAEGLELSNDIVWAAWEALSAQGAATDADLDRVLAGDDTAAGRLARLRAWASRPEEAVKREAWERAHVVGGETNHAVDALLSGFNAPGQAAIRAGVSRGYFDCLEQVWRDHPIEIAMRLVRGGFPDAGHVAGRAWLEAHPQAPATLVRLVQEAVHEEEIAARVRRD